MIALLLLARLLLAGVLMAAAVAKATDRGGTRRAFVALGGPTALAGVAAVALPLVETATAIALLLQATAWLAAVFATALLTLFTLVLAANLGKEERPACPCFGSARPTPIGRFEVARNLVLVGVAACLVVAGTDGLGPDVASWLLGAVAQVEGTAAAAGLFGATALATVIGGVAWVVQWQARAAGGREEARPPAALAASPDVDPKRADARGSVSPAGIDTPADAADAMDAAGATRPDRDPARPLLAPPRADDGLPIGSPTPFRRRNSQDESDPNTPARPTLLLFVSEQSPPCRPLLPAASAGGARQISAIGNIAAPPQPTVTPGLAAATLGPPPAADPQTSGQPPAQLGPADAWAAELCGRVDFAHVYLDGTHGDHDVDVARRLRVRWAPAALLLDERGRVASTIRYGNTAIAALVAAVGATCGGGPFDRERFAARQGESGQPAGTAGVPTGADLVHPHDPYRRRAGSGDPAGHPRGAGASGPGAGAMSADGRPGSGGPAGAAAIGTPAPALRLPDARGSLRALHQLVDRETALLFWHPECTYCQAIAPQLRRLEAGGPATSPRLVFVTAGPAPAGRRAQAAFSSLSLFDPQLASAADFGVRGTPSAILLDERGRIASAAAAGRDDVLALLGLPPSDSPGKADAAPA